MDGKNSPPEDVTRTVENLPDPPLSSRDLRDVGPGPSSMVAIPEDSEPDVVPEDAPRVRLYFPGTDIVARFETDTETWTVEAVVSPEGGV